MSRVRFLSRVLVAVILLVLLATPALVRAEEAAVTITLPPDLPAEQRDAFLSALERLALPVTVEDAAAASQETAEQPELALLIGRFDAAIAAAPEIPGLVARWFTGLEHTSFVGCLLALVMIAVALGLGLAAERLLRWALRGWRRRCLNIADQRFTSRLSAALGWFAIDLFGLTVFFGAASLAGWLLARARRPPASRSRSRSSPPSRSASSSGSPA